MRRILDFIGDISNKFKNSLKLPRKTNHSALNPQNGDGSADVNRVNTGNRAPAVNNGSITAYCGVLRTLWNNPWYRLAIYLLLLFILFVFPIKPGPINGQYAPNGSIPLIGQMEILCNEQNAKLLKKVTATYIATKAVTKSVAVIQEMQLNLGPISLAPGSYLSSAISSVDRVADGLFIVMAVMLVEKCTLGVIAWLCFKIIFPCAIILYIIYDYKKYHILPVLASFLCKCAILLLLFFPTLSFFSAKIDAGFATMTDKTLQEVAEFEKQSNDLAIFEEKGQAKSDSGFVNKWIVQPYSSLKNTIDQYVGKFSPGALMDKASSLLNSVENQVDKLFNLFAAFALSVIILPIGIILFYWKIFDMLVRSAKRDAITALNADRG